MLSFLIHKIAKSIKWVDCLITNKQVCGNFLALNPKSCPLLKYKSNPNARVLLIYLSQQVIKLIILDVLSTSLSVSFNTLPPAFTTSLSKFELEQLSKNFFIG